MPSYGYRCKSCEKEWSDLQKVDDRNIPTEQPCPSCSTIAVERLIETPQIVAGVQGVTHHIPHHFRDRLKQIKKNCPGNTIKDV